MKRRWPVVRLGEVAAINPERAPKLRDAPDALDVTFVPMAAVDEISGTITTLETRPLSAVRKGFTPFQDNDVLFAKITPCMQNGKSAIARGLKSGFGFGSTEFHVVRPTGKVLPEWIWYFVRQRSFREEARRHFRGTAGQQRVPIDFLTRHEMPLPPLEEQYRIVGRVLDYMELLDELHSLRGETILESEALCSALLRELLPNEGGREVRLGDVCSIKATLVDPKEARYAKMLHIGGANIQAGTGRLVDLKSAAEERLTSGKHVFSAKDVLYNKIRPYLRKVALPDFSGLCSADMYPLRPSENLISRAYLFFVLLSQRFTEYAVRVSNRAGMPKINRADLFSYRFVLPSLAEQQAAVSRLMEAHSATLSLRAEQNAFVGDRELIANAVLQRAFAGQL